MLSDVIQTACYAVAADVSHYAMLQETALELARQIDEPIGLYGQPLLQSWTDINVGWFYNPDEPQLPRPDIAAFGSTAFAASADTCEKLKPLLSEYVEFLPICVEGVSWFIIHVLARENVFNEQESKRFILPNGKPTRVFETLVLDGNRAMHGVLFRVTNLGLGIYTTGREHAFKTVIEKLGLTGLRFEKVQ